MSHLIELKDIYKIYHMGEETVHALDGINLTVDQGEFVAIVGSSGSGKSTAMNIIGCLDVPTSGTYHLGGIDVSTMEDDQQAEIRNKMLGFIFQQYNLIPKLTVQENVELPLLYAGVSAEERRERAIQSLERVGLADNPGRRAYGRPGLPHGPGGAAVPAEAEPGGGHRGPHHSRQLHRCQGQAHRPSAGRPDHLRRGRQ